MSETNEASVQSVVHTPGPWSVIDHTRKAPFQEILCIPEVDFTLECDVFSHIDDTDRANAKLIAAAPDMLATLRECVAWFKDNDVDCLAADEARSAIKQAVGE